MNILALALGAFIGLIATLVYDNNAIQKKLKYNSISDDIITQKVSEVRMDGILKELNRDLPKGYKVLLSWTTKKQQVMCLVNDSGIIVAHLGGVKKSVYGGYIWHAPTYTVDWLHIVVKRLCAKDWC